MQLTTKRPAIKNHIGMCYGNTIDNKALKDKYIQELIDLGGEYDFAMNYTYAIYADTNTVISNIFLPIFHTIYLNSSPKLIIIRNKDYADIMELYPYHSFYVCSDQYTESDYAQLKDQFTNSNLNFISSIKDIIQ